jgi:hypothetical protein
MMVVVLGDEEAEIDDGHRLAQSRMKPGAGELGGRHPCNSVYDAAAHSSEFGENLRDRTIVVSGLVRLTVLEIGWMELGGAGFVIIEALVP